MRSRLSYANVVASVALFVGLGGTSYAVIKLPRNSVGTREVRNRSLRAIDLAKDVVPSLTRGPRGAQGPQGPSGASGGVGPSDIFSAGRTNVALSSSAGASTDVVTLNVPAGSWWLLGSASIVFNGSGAVSDAFRCSLTYGATGGTAGAVSVIGVAGGSAGAADLVVHEGHELTGPSLVRLRCSHDQELPSGNPHVESAQLSAIKTSNLQIQPG